MSRFIAGPFAPWCGLVAGMVGEGLHHQVLSDMLHFDCQRGGAWPGLLWGSVLIVFIAGGAAVSWFARDAGGSATRRFIADSSLMAAGLFGLAIAWQTLAGFIVPACPS
jgi:hypothetical protein